MALRIAPACSLCGHPYDGLFNEPEMTEHMAEAHDMHFDPGSLRGGVPPHWFRGDRHPDHSPHSHVTTPSTEEQEK